MSSFPSLFLRRYPALYGCAPEQSAWTASRRGRTRPRPRPRPRSSAQRRRTRRSAPGIRARGHRSSPVPASRQPPQSPIASGSPAEARAAVRRRPRRSKARGPIRIVHSRVRPHASSAIRATKYVSISPTEVGVARRRSVARIGPSSSRRVRVSKRDAAACVLPVSLRESGLRGRGLSLSGTTVLVPLSRVAAETGSSSEASM